MSAQDRLHATVIISMLNSSSTVVPCLEGIVSQRYPVDEIIVVDNRSRDDSVAKVEAFAKQSPVPVRLIKQTFEGAIGDSYNLGAALAGSPLLILVHSDGAFPSPDEIGRLTSPLHEDPECVAACPRLMMPREVWERFPYWQKHLFSRAMGRENHSMCGKFDCVRKEVFVGAGGYDAKRFTATCGYGGEDSDAHFRISKRGRVAQTDARVIHLHDLSANFSLGSLFKTRKRLALTYAKVLQFQGFQPTPGKLSFFVRPVLAVLPLIPHFWGPGLALLLFFSIANSWRMYTSRSTLCSPRIFLLPFVDVALVYYEAFWFVQGLLTSPADARPRGESRA